MFASKRAYGIDYSGLMSSNEKTACYVLEVSKVRGSPVLRATKVDDLSHAMPRQSPRSIDDYLAAEFRLFLRAKKEGAPVVIDAAVDNDTLLSKDGQKFFDWELTKRPVDFITGGQSPNSSLFGHLTARIQAVQAKQNGRSRIILGRHLFECYPRAALFCVTQKTLSFERLRKYAPGHSGGRAEWVNGSWIRDPASPPADSRRNSAVARICNALRISPGASHRHFIESHDLDAIICAITGLLRPRAHLREEMQSELLRRHELLIEQAESQTRMRYLRHLKSMKLPIGYRLPRFVRPLPKIIVI